MPRGEVIRAEKGAWRMEPYLMEQPGGRLGHAGKIKGNKKPEHSSGAADPWLSAPWRPRWVLGWGVQRPSSPQLHGEMGGLPDCVGFVRDEDWDRLREAQVCTWSPARRTSFTAGRSSDTGAGSAAGPRDALGSLCGAAAFLQLHCSGERRGKTPSTAPLGIEFAPPAGLGSGGAHARGVLGAGERSHAGDRVHGLSARHGRGLESLVSPSPTHR